MQLADVSTIWNQVVLWASWLLSFTEVKVILATVGINFVVAVAATLYSSEFVLARTAEFLYRKALPYVMVWAVFRILGESAGYGNFSVAVFAVLELSLLGDLADNLKKLGLPIPDLMTKDRMA